jgi:hypothetical protein
MDIDKCVEKEGTDGNYDRSASVSSFSNSIERALLRLVQDWFSM